jgi:hypothetical protein
LAGLALAPDPGCTTDAVDWFVDDAGDDVTLGGPPAAVVDAVGLGFFLCSDLWTTGAPSEVVAFVFDGVVAVAVETTVTSSSAERAVVPQPATARMMARRYRQLGAVIATVFLCAWIQSIIRPAANPLKSPTLVGHLHHPTIQIIISQSGKTFPEAGIN